MTSPFLSRSLLELALQVELLTLSVKEEFFERPEVLSKEKILATSFEAFLETMPREVDQWPHEYAQELMARWDEIFGSAGFNSLLLENPHLRAISEKVEMFFLDHLRAWAAPRGQAPLSVPGAQHQRKTFEVAARMLSQNHLEVGRRLLDWPGATQAFVAGYRGAPKTGWREQFGTPPRGCMNWCGLLHKFSAPALAVLLEQGQTIPSYESGIPVLAAAENNEQVALVVAHTEDLLAPHRPFEQRKQDLRSLLLGWNNRIEEHLLRTGRDGRRDFSVGQKYLAEKLKTWPQDEVQAALLPWLSTNRLNESLGQPAMSNWVSTWVLELMEENAPPMFEHYYVKENDCTWSFEQWCAVRFLRGHGNRPIAHTQGLNVRLAKTFSRSRSSKAELQRTADLYKLLAWADPHQPKEQTPVEYVPLERLIPLLTNIMSGDDEPPAKERDRLHQIMLSIGDSPVAQEAPEMAPLVVAYTQWAWRNPQRSSDLASVGVLEWLTHPAHADLLTPGDAHFVAVNMMTSSIPLSQPLAQAAWDFLKRSMERQGHKQDLRTPALPSAFEASGPLRAMPEYKAMVRASSLEEGLPEATPRKPKMRF